MTNTIIIIIIITIPINTLAHINNFNILQMVKFTIIAITLTEVSGHKVKIIILIIIFVNMVMIYVMVITLAIITIIITVIMLNFDWTQLRLGYSTTFHGIIFNPYKLVQPKLSHSWPVASLSRFWITQYLLGINESQHPCPKCHL